MFLDCNPPYSSQHGVLEVSLWWHTSKPYIVVLPFDDSPIASLLLIMHSYLNEIHCGLGPPIFTSRPLHSGCVILILIRTRIQRPRQLPLADSSTYSALLKELLMASAFSLFIHPICSPQICTQKDVVSNLVSSTIVASPR